MTIAFLILAVGGFLNAIMGWRAFRRLDASEVNVRRLEHQVADLQHRVRGIEGMLVL